LTEQKAPAAPHTPRSVVHKGNGVAPWTPVLSAANVRTPLNEGEKALIRAQKSRGPEARDPGRSQVVLLGQRIHSHQERPHDGVARSTAGSALRNTEELLRHRAQHAVGRQELVGEEPGPKRRVVAEVLLGLRYQKSNSVR